MTVYPSSETNCHLICFLQHSFTDIEFICRQLTQNYLTDCSIPKGNGCPCAKPWNICVGWLLDQCQDTGIFSVWVFKCSRCWLPTTISPMNTHHNFLYFLWTSTALDFYFMLWSHVSGWKLSLSFRCRHQALSFRYWLDNSWTWSNSKETTQNFEPWNF